MSSVPSGNPLLDGFGAGGLLDSLAPAQQNGAPQPQQPQQVVAKPPKQPKAKQAKSVAAAAAAAAAPVQTPIVDELLGRRRLCDLLHDISPHDGMEPEVEMALVEIAEEFVESVSDFACRLAKHRKSKSLDPKDLRLHLEKTWGLRVGGLQHGDDVRSSKRKADPKRSHADPKRPRPT